MGKCLENGDSMGFQGIFMGYYPLVSEDLDPENNI